MMHEDEFPYIMQNYKELRKEGLKFPPRDTTEKFMIQFKGQKSPLFDVLEDVSSKPPFQQISGCQCLSSSLFCWRALLESRQTTSANISAYTFFCACSCYGTHSKEREQEQEQKRKRLEQLKSSKLDLSQKSNKDVFS